MNEILKLNIEISNLNEIIRNKNKTIKEFRDISELSKQKFEDLVKNNKILLEKINDLEEENKKLQNQNNSEDELNKIKRENEELKKKLKEKNEEIYYLQKLNKKRDRLEINIGKKKNISYSILNQEKNNDIKEYKEENNKENNERSENGKKPKSFRRHKEHSFVNTKIIKRGIDVPFCDNYFNKNNNNGYKSHLSRGGSFYSFNRNLSMKTEPSFGNISKIHGIKDKYLLFKNIKIEPLDYSNYLLDNLQNKICSTLIEN
jgi:predicted nuclease with TOPRIM domain